MSNNIYSCIIIGTGFSGLAMAIKLKEQGIENFTILEKKDEVGGTWRENTYPGAECDIPSALYSYSFEPYPFWEYKWAIQTQILEYIKHVATKYNLYPHIHFQQEMTSAIWNETEGYWRIKTKTGEVFKAKTMVNAIGQLHHPSTPALKGKDDFQGESWHSAQWNHQVDLSGKTVGVVGNAASAVQFIPEIAKKVNQLVIFQRTPNWVLPKQDRHYKEWEKKLVAKFPLLLKTYRIRLWLMGGIVYLMMQQGNNFLRKILEKMGKSYIKKHIKDPELVEKLTPKYPLGSKRLLLSDLYYAALALPHVKVITDTIESIEKDGVKVANHTKYPLDALIYATGFKTNPFLLGLEVKGKNGISIQEHWGAGTKNYLGISTHNFPNMFMMYGPNTNLGHNSIILMIEAQANYIAQCVRELEINNWKSMEVKETIENEYFQNIQDRLKKMIWTKTDHSWYQSKNGHIPNNYPGRSMEYIRQTKKVDFEDYTMQRISVRRQITEKVIIETEKQQQAF